MAAEDKKISELTAASALTGAESVEVVQGGVNKQTTTQEIADLASGGVSSVNGETGAVTLNAADVGADASGSAAAAQAAAIAAGVSATVGVQDLFFPASAFLPRVTNGCGSAQTVEVSASGVNAQVLPFDQTTQEYAQIQITPPRKWNNGTITFVPYWMATTGSGTVRWTLQGGMYRNDDALSAAFGTAQNSDDTLLAANDLHAGPESSAITLSGTGQDGNMVWLQVSRDPANDTLNADALLLGISVRFTTDAAKDA